MRFDLSEGFPLVTTKKLHMKSIVVELLWFLAGETNIAISEGQRRPHLGRVGGREGRARPGLRQAVADLADGRMARRSIRSAKPSTRSSAIRTSRRIIVSAWNPGRHSEDGAGAVPLPFQFYVADGKLSCQLYQRSADVFLGVPFNIASYALLTMMMAQVTGLKPGDFVHTFGDAHLYLNHLEQADLQLSRTPRALPRMKINPDVSSIFGFRI